MSRSESTIPNVSIFVETATSWGRRVIAGTYVGPGETSAHVLQLGGWQADGILESNGTGPLVWSGNVAIGPTAELITSDISLTLGCTTSSGENVFSGTISDEGVTLPDTTPATLRINKTGQGTWALTGNNAFSGATTLNGGTLAVSSFNSVNGGTPLLAASSLGNPKTIEDGTIAISSGTLRYTGNGETTDRVIHLAGSSGATLDHNGSGWLRFTSPFTSNSSTKTLTLTGGGSGEIAGGIPDNSSTHKTSVVKSGSGTWNLSGTNTYTGTTTISAGTLVVDGTIASGGNLTVSASAGILTGTGVIATPSVISGTLAVSPLAFTNTLTIGSTGKLLATFNSNHAGGIGPIAGSTVTINSGAKVNVALNGPGSTTNFLQSWWRGTRVIPILTATAKTGSLAIGTVTTDSAGNGASTYGTFSLQQTATAVNLVWTPLPGFPDIDTPTISLVTPTADPVSITDTLTTVRAAVATGGNPDVTWSLLSGPGNATFTNPNAAETGVSFTAAGTHVIQANAANALGSANTGFTVHVAPPLAMGFRQGDDGLSHPATFIRGDNPAWNSGSRDQFLIGRTSAPFRALLSFDLSAVPSGATVTSASLDLRSAGLGVGTLLDTVQLHELLVPFHEGTGDGVSATNGSGTGADWHNRDVGTAWTAPGTSATTDYASLPIAGLSGFNPSTFSSGTPIRIQSTPDFITAAARAVTTSVPLRLLLRMDADTTGSTLYARIASDDHPNASYRPRLTLALDHAFAPAIDPGPPPSPAPGTTIQLQGTVSNAATSTWTQLDGPAPVNFGNPSSPASTAVFPAPGTYQLSLSAANANGEARKILQVTAFTRQESWRQTHFGTTANAGDAANDADPERDGHANLLEFATGHLPYRSDGSIINLTDFGPSLEFTYRRSHDAEADGVGFIVEWSADLSGDWSAGGVVQSQVPDTDNGVSTLWKATLPAASPQRFVRLKTTPPTP